MTIATSDPWDAPVDVATAAQLNAYGIRVSRDVRRDRYRLRCGDIRAWVPRAAVVGEDVVEVFKQALTEQL